jgi:hypothetical protein
VNQPFLPDISEIVRLLIALGLVAGVAAHVIARMAGRRGREGLPMQLLGIAAIGIFAGVLLVTKPAWGGACAKFLFENVVDPLLPQNSTQAVAAPQTRQR